MVTQAQSEIRNDSLLVLDLHADGLSRRIVPPGDCALTLMLGNVPRKKFRSGNPVRQVQNVLKMASRSCLRNLQKTVVVLGVDSDPFVPFEGKFDAALRSLELLAQSKPKLLCIQTRSPLIVLALPVLKALGDRVRVTIALETLSDRLAAKATPALPRPSERIKALRVMKTFGIIATAQAAPLPSERNFAAFAKTLDEIATYVQVAEVESLLCRPGMVWRSDAAATLKAHLTAICPDKVLNGPEGAWEMAHFGGEVATAAVA